MRRRGGLRGTSPLRHDLRPRPPHREGRRLLGTPLAWGALLWRPGRRPDLVALFAVSSSLCAICVFCNFKLWHTYTCKDVLLSPEPCGPK